ncbi:hypothetical protein [Nocardia sp. NPDC052566]|uniref:hypothetical protein n=1 Tax=Nocardia sp. NPDC052566 TaxID=3364330 RepID=UPI0037CB1C3A
MIVTSTPDVVADQAQRDATVVETSPDRHLLPDWHQLAAAFRGELGRSPGDHLVTRWAGDFANLHRARHLTPKRAPEIDCRRAQIVGLVDGWTETHVTTTRHGSSPTQSVGAVVDEVAAAYVAAEYCLMTADDVAAFAVHAAWVRAAELACRWSDLVAQNPGRWRSSRVVGQELR